MDTATNPKIKPLKKGLNKFTKWQQAERIKEPLPPYLIIHLKRFDDQLKKINDDIQFPEDGKIEIRQDEDSTKYKIIAYVNHYGRTLEEGHYMADIENCFDLPGEERWIHCDDEDLTLEPPRTPGKSAYLVILKQISENG